jgi:spermidine synthase
MSGPLLISMLLFFVPGFLLGIVSPYVIKLQSLHTPEDRVGSVVGATFFWGTVGSILGSLLSGFYLVPFIGAKQSLVYTGALLVLVGICGELGFELLRKGRGRALYVIKRRALYLIGSLLIVMILWKLIAMTSTRLMLDVVHESEGIYSHILVYEANHLGKRIRAMKRDTNSSSATYLDTHELVYGYTQFAGLYTLLKPDAARFLLIGGGAYSIPRTLVAYDPKIIVDVVEIEPVLFELSREYFDLSDVSRINNHVMDGRVFLQKSDATYDVIFGDAFGTDLGVPHHLASKEFFEEAKRHLTPEGLFLLNFVGTLYQEPLTLTGSLMKTIESVFPNMKVYAFNKRRPDTLQNIMVIARNGSEPIDLEGTRINGTNGGILSIPSLEVSFEDFDLEHEIILTDDRAPLEYLMVRQY